MKHLKKFNESIVKEEFDAMVGINNFLNNPVMIALATAWLLSGKYKANNLKNNLIGMKDDFISYCNLMGYPIDKDILDLKFNELITMIKKIVKL